MSNESEKRCEADVCPGKCIEGAGPQVCLDALCKTVLEVIEAIRCNGGVTVRETVLIGDVKNAVTRYMDRNSAGASGERDE